MKNPAWLCLLLLAACDAEPTADAGAGTDAPRLDGGATDAGDPGDAATDAQGVVDTSAPVDAGVLACDYQMVDGAIVIEAEDLPIGDDWRAGTADGVEYIEWAGAPHNNDPTFGEISVALRFTAAGRYRIQWRTRVGMGTDATEHNDAWLRFADVDGFFGVQGPSTAEDRVYPRPRCEDTAFLATVLALPDVTEASCPNGSSVDGWFKVYSSGALDWRWSARTSDSDAHDVVVEIDGPGVYTMEIAARADFSQLDRIVVHELSLENAEVQDLARATTPCP